MVYLLIIICIFINCNIGFQNIVIRKNNNKNNNKKNKQNTHTHTHTHTHTGRERERQRDRETDRLTNLPTRIAHGLIALNTRAFKYYVSAYDVLYANKMGHAE